MAQAEYEHISTHVTVGHKILADLKSFDEVLPVVLSHHESYDGGGYPNGLRGGEIPLAARIVAVADVFDAVTSVRVYKDAIAPQIARRLIDQERGRQFDPAVVDAFQDSWSEFLEVQQGSLPTGLVVCSD